MRRLRRDIPVGHWYKGWLVRFNPINPTTGRWTARRFGVRICAGDKDTLQRMIDRKVMEANR